MKCPYCGLTVKDRFEHIVKVERDVYRKNCPESAPEQFVSNDLLGSGSERASVPGREDKAESVSSTRALGRVPAIGKLLNCDCSSWGTELTQQTIHDAIGAYFVYCPWCGKLLLTDKGSERP